MTVDRLTPDAARVLRLLAAGKTCQQAGDAAAWPTDRVVALAKAQKGWLIHPDTGKVYDPNRKDGTVQLPPGVDERAAQADMGRVEMLLAKAEASNDPKLRKLAATARKAVDDIVERLVSEQQAAALAKEIERLQQQLAAKQAKHRELTGRRMPGVRAVEAAAAPAAKVRRAGIRAWAASQGLDCPANGRIPKHIETAYDEAHGGAQ